MFYRETGQFKSDYAEDAAILPLREDRFLLGAIIVVALCAPLIGGSFFLQVIMIPFLVFALAGLGLNLLTGYAGLLSLGTGAFMGVGAYACYKLTTYFPNVNIVIWVLISGVFSAGIGVAFGLPSLRIKGFYLAVATLAAQFFLQWCFVRIPWLYNDNLSGAIEVPERSIFGIVITGARSSPEARYYVVLAIVGFLTWIASNLANGRMGRSWMAVRDMEVAAELMGIRLLRAKLLAFAISSFYCGVAGAMMVFFWYATGAEYNVFDVEQSFFVLFIIIIGGLGSIIGPFMGAALIYILPIFLGAFLPAIFQPFGVTVGTDTIEHARVLLLGIAIITFLVVEPQGLARLWHIGRQKLRTWPFPY